MSRSACTSFVQSDQGNFYITNQCPRQTSKIMIRPFGYAVWFGPTLSVYAWKTLFSWCGSNVMVNIITKNKKNTLTFTNLACDFSFLIYYRYIIWAVNYCNFLIVPGLCCEKTNMTTHWLVRQCGQGFFTENTAWNLNEISSLIFCEKWGD